MGRPDAAVGILGSSFLHRARSRAIGTGRRWGAGSRERTRVERACSPCPLSDLGDGYCSRVPQRLGVCA